MKVLKIDVPGDKLVLDSIGDLHFGHANCNKDMVENVVEHIKRKRNLWLGMGDYGDAVIPTDPRFDYRNIDPAMKTPQEQYDYCEDLFTPIAHKCVGLLDGNHDLIHWKRHAQHYTYNLARRLNVESLTVTAYIRFHFTKYNADFDVFATHGHTAARTKTGAINSISQLANVTPQANLYLMGHTHQLGLVDERASLYIDGKLNVRDHLQYFAFTGSFLAGYVKDRVSYVEEKTYRPTVLGALEAEITPRIKEDTVTFEVETRRLC